MALRLLQLGALALVTGTAWAQMPPPPAGVGRPPMHDERSLADRLAEARLRRSKTRAVDITAQRALEYSNVYLDRAERALKSDQPFVCDRLLAAAESLRHIAQVRERLHEPSPAQDRDHPLGPEGERGLAPPADALQWAYFRVQQADYFYEQSHDPAAKSFPKWAKDFYQLSLRDMDRKDSVAAEANAHCAEEVVRALENIAQAAAPMPPRPSGLNPPRPGHPPAMPDAQPPPPPKSEPAAGPGPSSQSRTEEIFG